VLWAALFLLGLYVIVIPTVLYFWEPVGSPTGMQIVHPPTLPEILNQKFMETFFAGLFFSVGATVGSFLNVVAYRMPRGLSVVWRRSSCPHCGTGLGPKENLPVVGWFLLGGKCRFCQNPISGRYPLVEGITGAIFLLLYFVQLISGGTNLPNWFQYSYQGVVWILLYTKWEMVAIYVYHVLLFVWLLIFTLFAWDRQFVPRRALIIGILMQFLPPLWLSYLCLFPVPLTSDPHWNRILAMGLGGLAGWLLAIVLKRLTLKDDWKQGVTARDPLACSLILIGITLGWQALGSIVLGVAIWRLLTRILRVDFFWRGLPFAGWLLVFALIHHCFWKQMVWIG
jgi:leader peptidase (prepilin peptidase)/N-methyltransferase